MDTGRLDTITWLARDVITHRLARVDAARGLAVLAVRRDDELARFGELAAAWDATATVEERDEVERRILEEASLLVADTA